MIFFRNLMNNPLTSYQYNPGIIVSVTLFGLYIMQMMDWGEYQPVIQEAKAPHSLPANRALQKYRPPEVGNAEQICNVD